MENWSTTSPPDCTAIVRTGCPPRCPWRWSIAEQAPSPMHTGAGLRRCYPRTPQRPASSSNAYAPKRTQDHAVARDRGVLVHAGNRPVLALGVLPADPNLVFDSSGPLLVGRVPGIQRGVTVHGAGSPVSRRPCPAACRRWRHGASRSARARCGARASSPQSLSALPARRCPAHISMELRSLIPQAKP